MGIESYPPIATLLVIVGLFFIFLVLVDVTGYINLRVRKPLPVACIGLTLVVLGMISAATGIPDQKLVGTPEPEPTPADTGTEIKITYPSDTAQVQENITGSAKNIPEGDEIWIFVHPDGVNKYYPQDSSAIIQNGEWSLSVGIGSENDAGRKFEIIAVLADKEAQEEITNYFKTCEETRKWPGMNKIPDSAKEYNKITVIRIGPEIKITSPLNTANIQENIQGTAKNIPEGKTAWLFIYPHTAYKYYPINKLDIRDEKWSCPAQFGEPKDAGTQFDIVVVLADKEAHAELESYLETCIETKTWPGIMTLPVGATEYSRVTVTRE